MPKAKRRFSPRNWLPLLLTILLVGTGLIAAVILSQRPQDVRQQAAAGQTCTNPLGRASDFNVFVLGRATQSNTDTEGRMAAGGAITLTNYSVGSKSSGPRNTLIGGQSITYTNGTVYNGDAVYNTTGSFNNVNFTAGESRQASPLNFETARAELRSLTQTWASLPANGTTQIVSNQVVFNGTDSKLNVFSVSASDLSNAKGTTITAPSGSTVLVNVTGTTATLSNQQITLGGIDASKVVYNFPEATSLNITSVSVQGSVMAPLAAVTFNGANINGTLVARTLEGDGESHHVPFTGCVGEPQPSPSPSPVACTTFDVGRDGNLRLRDNMQVTTQYQREFGLSFRGIPSDRNPRCAQGPRLAREGAPWTAFEGDNIGPDKLLPGTEYAPWFLTDDGVDHPGQYPCGLIVDIDQGRTGNKFYFDILDLDEREMYTVRAYNSANRELLSQRIGTPTDNSGNSTSTRVNLVADEEIARIRIVPDASQKDSNWGIGFDNFCVYK